MKNLIENKKNYEELSLPESCYPAGSPIKIVNNNNVLQNSVRSPTLASLLEEK